MDVVIVYDASGSMWGQIDGVTKIEIARDVMADLVHGWSEDTHLGLVAYGHRSEGDCGDIETLIEPKRLGPRRFHKYGQQYSPKGQNPHFLLLSNMLQTYYPIAITPPQWCLFPTGWKPARPILAHCPSNLRSKV
ncbi:hypothetical protein ACFOLL_09745 [Falsochrobactrum ovis]|uniref:hypothetical protein n=1 Tax=Falsochrobactrum ovis TaxID=1293442 RepID=UPI0036107D3B